MTLRDFSRAALFSSLAATSLGAVLCAPNAVAFERRDIACELEDLTRLISLRVDPDAGYVCDVLYEKPDEGDTREVVWSARNDVDYCKPRFDSLVEGLASRGWTCDYAETPTGAADRPLLGAARDERSEDDEVRSEGARGKFRDRCIADVASGGDAEGVGSAKVYCDCVTDGMGVDGLSEEDAEAIFGGLASLSREDGEGLSIGDKRLNTLAMNYRTVADSCR